ncbi:DUF6508 domain-containing protein [Corallincola spongiicola]|uniref:Uncharacterized protein n=1 Tax=Corallincola spongiicola TaxID=2520508 RepID=A0ABY1WMP9_9GAMM|nr:DUF6508 domain-containing protein [Corallincola spongiicola]TAA43686.1 hypothetical protein EXY25_14135 [Corallincola spongiicola]
MNNHDLQHLEEKYQAAIDALKHIKYHGAYPIYPAEISDFMGLLVQLSLSELEYRPAEVEGILASIEKATLSQIRCIFMACNRSERFGDGSWKAILEQRQLDPVLERLHILLKEGIPEAPTEERDETALASNLLKTLEELERYNDKGCLCSAHSDEEISAHHHQFYKTLVKQLRDIGFENLSTESQQIFTSKSLIKDASGGPLRKLKELFNNGKFYAHNQT